MLPEIFAGGLVLFAGGVFSIRAAERTEHVGSAPAEEIGSEVSPGIDHVSVEGAGIALLGLVMMLASTAL